MTRYVALLRGIGPTNPNMANGRLREVCEAVGLTNVTTVISSGNVVFDTDRPAWEIENTLQDAWPERLGFNSTTILRSQSDLERLVDLAPFGDLKHAPETYLLVTFAKHPLVVEFEIPHQPPKRDYRVVATTVREIFSVTDTVANPTTDLMSWVEKEFGKEISSRTWLTVERILKRMRS